MADKDTTWRPLFRMAAVAALFTILTIPAQVVLYVISPPPESVEAWFAHFAMNPALALINLDLLYISSQVLLIPVFLALFIALRNDVSAVPLVALAVGFFGVVIHTTSNPSIDMLLASQRYASATTETERQVFLAVGEGLMIQWQGTAYALGYIIGGVAVLLFSLAMRKSAVFGHAIAWTGIVLGGLWLVPASFGVVGLTLSFLSLLPTVIWLSLLARRFWMM
ncbi:MAG: hypothetical protein AAF125_11945, partial [Chloroflexota bacterium]